MNNFTEERIPMKFDVQKLNEYKYLLETTNLQQDYQEFITLFRFIRRQLAHTLVNFSFSGNIIENRMDFSYFQLLSPELNSIGVKLQVVFVHADFRFEIWISGYNRKIQCLYHDYFIDKSIPYILNPHPSTVDYIFKVRLNKDIDLSDSEYLIAQLTKEILALVSFITNLHVM